MPITTREVGYEMLVRASDLPIRILAQTEPSTPIHRRSDFAARSDATTSLTEHSP